MAEEVIPPNPPAPPSGNLVPINIEDEMRRSYVDYAMSVIIGRALPDVRDGLKPVHRRILYGMRDMGLASNRAYRKCAKIVGEVMGNYHPHGDGFLLPLHARRWAGKLRICRRRSPGSDAIHRSADGPPG